MPYSAPSRCTNPGCSEVAMHRGRCFEHQRKPWANRTSPAERYGQSGSARQKLHKSVLQDAGYICYSCGLPGADTVDHIIPIWKGGAKRDRGNLGAIHQEPCHEIKTKRENAERAATRRSRAKPPRD